MFYNAAFTRVVKIDFNLPGALEFNNGGETFIRSIKRNGRPEAWCNIFFLTRLLFAALTMMPITGAGDNPANLPHSPYPPGFGAAMAAAMANQQLASLMTSQGLPFMPHAAIQAMYSSPTSKFTAAFVRTKRDFFFNRSLPSFFLDSFIPSATQMADRSLSFLSPNRSDVRATAGFHFSPPVHVDQRAVEQELGSGGRDGRFGRFGAAPLRQSARIAVAGYEPGDAQSPRPELDEDTQGRTGARGILAIPVSAVETP